MSFRFKKSVVLLFLVVLSGCVEWSKYYDEVDGEKVSCKGQGRRSGLKIFWGEATRFGPWVCRWKTGEMQARGSYSDDERYGEWQYFDQTGNEIGTIDWDDEGAAEAVEKLYSEMPEK